MKDSFIVIDFVILIFIARLVCDYDYAKNEINNNIVSCNCCNQNT